MPRQLRQSHSSRLYVITPPGFNDAIKSVPTVDDVVAEGAADSAMSNSSERIFSTLIYLSVRWFWNASRSIGLLAIPPSIQLNNSWIEMMVCNVDQSTFIRLRGRSGGGDHTDVVPEIRNAVTWGCNRLHIALSAF